jgi:hypothetical protein
MRRRRNGACRTAWPLSRRTERCRPRVEICDGMPRPMSLAADVALLLLGCRKPPPPILFSSLAPSPSAVTSATAPDPGSASVARGVPAPSPAAGSAMNGSTSREAIESQYRAILAGAPIEAIARYFTPRLQERCSRKAKDVLVGIPIDDLTRAKVEPGRRESEGEQRPPGHDARERGRRVEGRYDRVPWNVRRATGARVRPG